MSRAELDSQGDSRQKRESVPAVTNYRVGGRIILNGEQVTESGKTARTPNEARRNSHNLSINQRIVNTASGHAYIILSDIVEGTKSGEGEVIHCRREGDNKDVALKFYLPGRQLRIDIINEVLRRRHPNIIEVHEIGEWEKCCFEVMDYCKGGSLFDLMPLTEKQIREYLPSILNGLECLHSFGTPSIIHRDLKPANLLFRTRECRPEDLVIADFGISSMCEGEESGDERVMYSTITPERFTPDYVAPELAKGLKIGPISDYYSLGMTLLHVLSKDRISPMDLWPTAYHKVEAHKHGTVLRLLLNPAEILTSDNELIGRNTTMVKATNDFYGSLSPQFKILFTGLLQVNPKYRWGCRQVRQWLDNEEIRIDDGTQRWQPERFSGDGIPYPRDNLRQAVHKPDQLAKFLDDSDIVNQIYNDLNDTLPNWVSNFSGELKDEIVRLHQQKLNRNVTIFKLQFLLDPGRDFEIAGQKLHTFADFVRFVMTADDERTQSAIEERIWDERLELWIDAGKENNLVVGDRTVAKKTFVEFLHRLHADSGKSRSLTFYELRWYFFPEKIPFPFGRETAATPAELAALIDRDEESRQKGISLLRSRWIDIWLASRYGENAAEVKATRKLALEKSLSDREICANLLHVLDKDRKAPRLIANRKKINFGRIPSGSKKTATVQMRASGEGYCWGKVELDPINMLGIQFSPQTIDTTPAKLTVTVDPGRYSPGSKCKASIVITEPSQSPLRIPILFRVYVPMKKSLGKSILTALIFGALFGGIRYCLNYTDDLSAYQTMEWFSWEAVRNADWKMLERIGRVGWIPVGAAMVFITAVWIGLYNLIRRAHR